METQQCTCSGMHAHDKIRTCNGCNGGAGFPSMSEKHTEQSQTECRDFFSCSRSEPHAPEACLALCTAANRSADSFVQSLFLSPHVYLWQTELVGETGCYCICKILYCRLSVYASSSLFSTSLFCHLFSPFFVSIHVTLFFLPYSLFTAPSLLCPTPTSDAFLCIYLTDFHFCFTFLSVFLCTTLFCPVLSSSSLSHFSRLSANRRAVWQSVACQIETHTITLSREHAGNISILCNPCTYQPTCWASSRRELNCTTPLFYHCFQVLASLLFFSHFVNLVFAVVVSNNRVTDYILSRKCWDLYVEFPTFLLRQFKLNALKLHLMV